MEETKMNIMWGWLVQSFLFPMPVEFFISSVCYNTHDFKTYMSQHEDQSAVCKIDTARSIENRFHIRLS